MGNHDQTPLGDPTGTTKFYNKYFGTARFSGRSYYGGHFGTNNDNSYQLFNAGGIGFLVISLELNPTTNFNASGGPLDWGENLIKTHPHRKVIVLSHYVLNSDATFSDQGNAIYNRFKVYPNFMLMSGGHVPDANAEAKRADSYNGNTVYTILSNYQGRSDGGHGLLRIYEFDPINNNIAVKTYSPYTNKYETDSDSQFNLKGNLTSTATSYEWFVELFDGENKTTGPAWSFTTKLQAGNIINSNPMQQTEMAVKKHSSNELFTIYPNPNNTNYLTLSFNKEIREEVSVEIFNITGYLQFKKTFKNIDNITSLEHNLPTGTYIVAVTTKNSKEAKKLVIIK